MRRTWLAGAVLTWVAVVGVTLTLPGCHRDDPAQSATPSAEPQATAAPSTAASSPSPTPTPAATPRAVPAGIVTVTLSDGSSYVGRFVTAGAFAPCDTATTFPFTANDTVRSGGQCEIAYSEKISTAVRLNVSSPDGAAAVVNSVAVSPDGSTALATFVSGAKTGQALLARHGDDWVVKGSTAAGTAMSAADAAAGGVPATQLRALQLRLKFDVTTPALPRP